MIIVTHTNHTQLGTVSLKGSGRADPTGGAHGPFIHFFIGSDPKTSKRQKLWGKWMGKCFLWVVNLQKNRWGEWELRHCCAAAPLPTQSCFYIQNCNETTNEAVISKTKKEIQQTHKLPFLSVWHRRSAFSARLSRLSGADQLWRCKSLNWAWNRE